MPPTKLYFDPAVFAFNDLIAAIRARCAEHGAEIRPPTFAELAQAQHERELFDLETERLLDGRAAYNEQVKILVDALNERAAQIAKVTGREVKAGEGMFGGHAIRDDRIAMDVTIQGRISGHSHDAFVRVRFFSRQIYFKHERRAILWKEPDQTDKRNLYLKRQPEAGWIWQLGEKQYTPTAMADFLMARFLELRVNYKPETF